MGYIARVLGVLIVFLSTFMFVNIDNVKAGESIERGPGYGYAQCTYRWDVFTDSTHSSTGSEAEDYYRLVVKVWGSKSDGKNWLNWNHLLDHLGVSSIDGSVVNEGHWTSNQYAGISANSGISSNDAGTTIFDAFYSESDNAAYGETLGKFSCPGYVCQKNEHGLIKWKFPSKTQLSQGSCGSRDFDKVTLNTSDGTTSSNNMERVNGDINITPLSEIESIKNYVDSTGADDGSLDSFKDKINNWGSNASYDSDMANPGDPCQTIVSNPWLVQMLNWLFWFIAIAGLVIFLVMSIMDFIKAVTGSDDANLKKAFKHLAIRAIVVVILFLLPALLNLIINFLNDNLGEEGTYKIGSDGNLYCDVISSE